MKAWFIFLIEGVLVGTWANNTDEAKANLVKEFGDVPMEFKEWSSSAESVDLVTYHGMSSVDHLIATQSLSW